MEEESMEHVDYERLLILDARDKMNWLVDEVDVQFSHVRDENDGTAELSLLHMAVQHVDRLRAIDIPRLRRLAGDARARLEHRCPWIKASWHVLDGSRRSKRP